MWVSEIYTRNPVSVGPDQTVQGTALVMTAHGLGTVAVVRQGWLVGVFGETDLARVAADGLHPASQFVGEHLRPGAAAVALGSDVADAIALLIRTGEKELPVVDRNIVVGYISLPRALEASRGPRESPSPDYDARPMGRMRLREKAFAE